MREKGVEINQVGNCSECVCRFPHSTSFRVNPSPSTRSWARANSDWFNRCESKPTFPTHVIFHLLAGKVELINYATGARIHSSGQCCGSGTVQILNILA